MRHENRPRPLASALTRGVLLAVLWWVLTEADPAGLVFGLVVVAGATAASLRLVPPGRRGLRPAALLRFIPFFVWQSLAGGVDVARRALHPGLPLQPALLEQSLRLPPATPGRLMFAAILSLLPGTLAVELQGGTMRMHVLDSRAPVRRATERLEEEIGRLFELRRTDPLN